ncbi:MAG: RluA family pseudouridine synthase [Planctomycetota bacterium]|jgi:23S rRNA pseudouridine1911/1915/1917 synthase
MPSQYPDELTREIGQEEAGRRIDRFLTDLFPETPRSRFKEWIENGEVLVDGLARKPSYRLRAGEVIRFTLPEPEEVRIEPEPIDVTVLHEDDQIMVVDKPAGLTVHPAPHQPSGTLVNALLHRGMALSDLHEDPFRPGIVHRLDRGTSGVLVVAKNRKAHASLASQFESRTVKKEYRAAVVGFPEHEEGEIDMPIGKDRKIRGKMAVRQDVGRRALTRFRVMERFVKHALLAVRIETGRTHQIRVHLSAIGLPVAADALYGGGPPDLLASALAGEPPGPDERPIIARPALHARRLTVVHPSTGEAHTFSAPLPEDFRKLLETLRAGSP